MTLKVLNTEWRTRYSLTNFEDHYGLHAPVIFFKPQYVLFLVHLYVSWLPNSSGQLAELIIHATCIPLEYICIVTPSYWQYTETEMSFWWNFHHWLHWKLSKWQLPVQPVMKILSKWQHFRFSVWWIICTSYVNYMFACRNICISINYKLHNSLQSLQSRLTLNHWLLRDEEVILFKIMISKNKCFALISRPIHVELLSGRFHRISLMLRQHYKGLYG